MPQAAKSRHMNISDTSLLQSPRQGRFVELRIMQGTRDRPHIDKAGYFMCPQQLNKVGECSRGMANRQHNDLAFRRTCWTFGPDFRCRIYRSNRFVHWHPLPIPPTVTPASLLDGASTYHNAPATTTAMTAMRIEAAMIRTRMFIAVPFRSDPTVAQSPLLPI